MRSSDQLRLPSSPNLLVTAGPIPASLATQHNLGVLSLGHNRLSGDLNAFAAALRDPEELAAANKTSEVSRLFDFNVTGNGLVGPVPENLAYLGIFNPVITILVPGLDGSAAVAPRVLDLSGNKFSGPWPAWLLKEVSERGWGGGEKGNPPRPILLDKHQACETFVGSSGAAGLRVGQNNR